MLRLLSAGVESVALKAGPGIEGVSAVVAFSSHHAASMAKKALGEGRKQLMGLQGAGPKTTRFKKKSVQDSNSSCAQKEPNDLLRV